MRNFKLFGKHFKKTFTSVYYVKGRCPLCKKEILANALICPYCKTDFRTATHTKRTAWQKKAMQFVLAVALIIGVSVIVSGIPFFIGLVIVLAIYGGGYVLVQKIQSLKNYHHR